MFDFPTHLPMHNSSFAVLLEHEKTKPKVPITDCRSYETQKGHISYYDPKRKFGKYSCLLFQRINDPI